MPVEGELSCCVGVILDAIHFLKCHCFVCLFSKLQEKINVKHLHVMPCLAIP